MVLPKCFHDRHVYGLAEQIEHEYADHSHVTDTVISNAVSIGSDSFALIEAY
jgi:hypothetical protein